MFDFVLPFPIEIEIGKNSNKYIQLDVRSEPRVSRCAMMALRHVHPRLDKSENRFPKILEHRFIASTSTLDLLRLSQQSCYKLQQSFVPKELKALLEMTAARKDEGPQVWAIEPQYLQCLCRGVTSGKWERPWR